MGVHVSQLPQSVKDKLGLKDTPYRQFWAIVGDKEPIYFRSEWEFFYSLFLEKLKQEKKILEWKHEPNIFWFKGIKRGVVSYLPDFLITHLNGAEEYVETKGFFDSKSQTKLKRMRIYFPEVNIRLVGKDWFKENIKACRALEPQLAKRIQKPQP